MVHLYYFQSYSNTVESYYKTATVIRVKKIPSRNREESFFPNDCSTNIYADRSTTGRIRLQQSRSTSLMHVLAFLFPPRPCLRPGFPTESAPWFEKSAERAQQSCNAGSEYQYPLEWIRNWLWNRVVHALAQSSLTRSLRMRWESLCANCGTCAQRNATLHRVFW